MNIFKSIKILSLGKIGILGFCLFAPVSIAISQIFIGMSILGWLLEMIRNKHFKWIKTPLDYPILFFLSTQTISVFRSNDILTAFETMIDTNWFILFFYSFINIIEDDTDFKTIFNLILISGAISALYGIWQHFAGWDIIKNRMLPFYGGNRYRVGGFVCHPLSYGGIQLIYLCLIFPLYFLRNNIKEKSIVITVCVLLIASIIAAFARSAWMGLGFAAIAAFFIWNKKYFLYSLLLVVILVLISNFYFPDNNYQRIFLSMFDASETAPFTNRVRLHLWETSINLIKDYPIFGVGISNFDKMFEIYKVPFDYQGLKEPHNDLLHFMAVSGILGGVAFLSIWIKALIEKFKVINKFRIPKTIWQAATLGGFFVVIALIIGGMTQEFYRDAEVAQVWWFAAGVGISGLLKSKEDQ